MRSEYSGAAVYKRYPVLFVDDDPGNLRAFELAFRRDFEVVTASSGIEALSRLMDTPVAVVLSDHRMPGMTGTEFLARAREVAPRAIRLLVTAYGDAATLADAINDGRIYRYIPKPWDSAEMRTIVRQSIDLYSLEEERQALVSDLSTLNDVSHQLSSLLDLGPLLACLQRAVVEDLGFDGSSVWLLGTCGNALRSWGAIPEIDGVHQDSVVLSRERSPEIFATLDNRQATIVNMSNGRLLGEELRAWLTLVSAEEVLILPLYGRRGLLGVLAVDNRRGGMGFGEAQRDLLAGLASQAATAIDNARLVGELRNNAARTSGSDALAIAAALGASIEREVRQPLATSAGHSSNIIGPTRALDVFAEILGEQVPRRWQLQERVERVRPALARLVEENSVQIKIEPQEGVYAGALPGRLLQLLLLLFEWAVPRSAGGVLTVRGGGPENRSVTLIAAPEKKESVQACDGMEAGSPRSVALAALLREIPASLEHSEGPRTETWTVRIDAA